MHIYLAGRKLLSPYMTNKLVQKEYSIEPETYHVCEKRSHMFYKHSKRFCNCIESNNRRYQADNVTPVATTSQIPLHKQLASYFGNKKSREMLLYRSKRESPPDGQLKDIFDGAVYKKHKFLFRNDLDLALALYIDGFNPQKRGSTSMVTFMAVILNLPPDIRSVL